MTAFAAMRWRRSTRRFDSRSVRAGLLAAGAVALALLMALMVGASQWLPVLALLGLGVAAGLMWLGTADLSQGLLRAIFVLGTLVVLFGAAAQQVVHLPLGYVLELLLFTLLFGTVLKVRTTMPHDRTLRWVALFFVLYLCLALLSSAFGRSHRVAAIWQFQYNLKWPAMFLVGTLFVWDARQDRLLKAVLALTWIPLVAGAGLEWGSPSSHQLLFGPQFDFQSNGLLGGLRRFRGPFPHAGYLALTSAAFAWCCTVYALHTRHWRWATLAVIYAGLLILTGQRQETAGLVLAWAGLAAVRLRRHWVLGVTLGVAAIGALVTLAIIFDYVPMKGLLAQWGWGDPLDPLSERAVLSTQGIGVANTYFPLGAGLGTYGGAGAQKFDQSLFTDLGFGRYWWFREGKFLLDVYWPSVAAEAGWFGAAALAACFLILLFGLLRRLVRAGGQESVLLMGIGALLILLSNTPSSAVITDPRGSFVLWLLIGAAWRHSQHALPRSRTARVKVALDEAEVST